MVHSASSRDTCTAQVAGASQALWLVRHGESTWNTLGLTQGHLDQARLTRRGERQARAVAAQLRSRPIGALHAGRSRSSPTAARSGC